jgi:hypothetical protein
MTLAFLRNGLLRNAITRNLVSFPSQIRPFAKRTVADLQVRVVQLYFVHGWPVRRICDRYKLRKDTVHKLLTQWRIRAIESGCIQEIEPGVLEAIIPEARDTGDEPPPVFHTAVRAEPKIFNESGLDSHIAPAQSAWELTRGPLSPIMSYPLRRRGNDSLLL